MASVLLYRPAPIIHAPNAMLLPSNEQSLCHSDDIGGWTLIVAVKDETVLRDTLLRSPDIDSRSQILRKYGYESASKAYNEGIAEATNEILVFAHTDVYLPKGWLTTLASHLKALTRVDPNWGVLGICGISLAGEIVGHLYSTGSQVTFGKPFDKPVETVSLDEVLLVIRRSSGVRFDENLRGFHLYGTDLCLEARRRGLKSYIISAFCIHNSNGVRSLPFSFWRAYFYLRKKWWDILPIRSCCTVITQGYACFASSLLTTIRQLVWASPVGARSPDPERLHREVVQPTSR
jgi:hypothetical protein